MEKIIHQTWKDNSPPRHIYAKEWQDSWKNDYPDWEYKFWTDEDNLSLVKEHYPKFFDFFSSIKKGVVKADFCRLLYLHKFGGLYVDMDFASLKNMEKYFNISGSKVCIGRHSNKYQPYPNAMIFCSKKGNPIFLEIFKYGMEAYNRGVSKIEAIAGPDTLNHFVNKKWRDFFVIDDQLIYPLPWGGLQEAERISNTSELNLQLIKEIMPNAFMVTFWRHNW